MAAAAPASFVGARCMEIAHGDPIARRGQVAEPVAVDVESHGLHTWDLLEEQGQEVRRLAQEPGDAAAAAVPAELPLAGKPQGFDASLS